MASTVSDPAPLMLSVSGARGIVGRTMTPVVAATFAGAFGSHIRTLVRGRRPRLVVARDGRYGGESLARAVQGATTSAAGVRAAASPQHSHRATSPQIHAQRMSCILTPVLAWILVQLSVHALEAHLGPLRAGAAVVHGACEESPENCTQAST